MDSNPQDERVSRLVKWEWRIIQGFGSFLGILCAAGVLYVRCIEPPKHGSWSERVASLISLEFFVALFVVSCVGLAWAIAAPKCLAKLCEKWNLRVLAV